MQLPLSLTAPEARPPWRLVRPTSIAAYTDGRDRFVGRKATVLRVLSAYYNAQQEWPTSAELCAWMSDEPAQWTDRLLYIRRGLSDLQKAGVVEPAGARHCRQHPSARTVESWRVIPAGR